MSMALRQSALSVGLFEFLSRYTGGWKHVTGDGYRELASIW